MARCKVCKEQIEKGREAFFERKIYCQRCMAKKKDIDKRRDSNYWLDTLYEKQQKVLSRKNKTKV